MTRFRTLLLAAAATALASPAVAQTGDPIRDFQNGVDPLSLQMRGQLQGMVQQALNDPAFWQAYQMRRQQGWQMSPEQYAEYWLRTGHDTPEGTTRAWGAQQQDNAVRQGQNNAYLRHQQQIRDQMNGVFDGQSWNSAEAGRTLQGTEARYDEETGRCYAVAYTPAGEAYQGEIACPPGYPQ